MGHVPTRPTLPTVPVTPEPLAGGSSSSRWRNIQRGVKNGDDPANRAGAYRGPCPWLAGTGPTPVPLAVTSSLLCDNLDQLQGRISRIPQVGKLLERPEAVGQVERSGPLVSFVGVLGTQGLHLKKLDAGAAKSLRHAPASSDRCHDGGGQARWPLRTPRRRADCDGQESGIRHLRRQSKR